jgi:hypothetical protein
MYVNTAFVMSKNHTEATEEVLYTDPNDISLHAWHFAPQVYCQNSPEAIRDLLTGMWITVPI